MFVSNETGAITVDWVVLTAAIVGLGLATMAVVSSGVQDTSGDIKGQMEGQIIYSSFGVSAEGFEGGAAGWSGANATTVNGFGAILGPIAGTGGLEAVTKTFEIPDGTDEAVFNFDLLAMDTLDLNTGDSAVLYVDGQVVATAMPAPGSNVMTWTFEDVPGVTVTATETSAGTNIGGRTSATDSINNVTITVANPSENVSIGMGSNANQGINDESYGIDNFTVQTAGLGT